MNKTFKCTLCGLCCSKSPISLLPHEDKILSILASKLGLPYKSKPGYKLFDRIRRSYIALSYAMELVDGKCVFLTKDNLCLIQDIYKPFICRSFPYVPKQVRYNIVWGLKTIFATTDYGLSVECPVIREDKEYVNKILGANPQLLRRYLLNEIKAAEEMERTRMTLLSMLSDLWRQGYIDIIDDPRVNAPVLNLYDLLRKYYPNLPYLLGIDKVLQKIGGAI